MYSFTEGYVFLLVQRFLRNFSISFPLSSQSPPSPPPPSPQPQSKTQNFSNRESPAGIYLFYLPMCSFLPLIHFRSLFLSVCFCFFCFTRPLSFLLILSLFKSRNSMLYNCFVFTSSVCYVISIVWPMHFE